MWSSKYTAVDTNGFEKTVKITVTYYNDTDARTTFDIIPVLPENIDSEDFREFVQQRVDLLEAKDSRLNKSVSALLATPDITTPVIEFIPPGKANIDNLPS